MLTSALLLLACAWPLTHTGGGQRPRSVTAWISLTSNGAQEGMPQLADELSLLAYLRGGWTYCHLLLVPSRWLYSCYFLFQFSHLENGESGVDLPQGGPIKESFECDVGLQ